MEVRPKVSVITVVRNAADTLGATIASVREQTWSPLEYVLIDGASDDGTGEVIAAHREGIDVLVSEPDNGIYAAMNKGLQRASGDLVLFLNADDRLVHPLALQRAVEQIGERWREATVFYGRILFYDAESGKGLLGRPREATKANLYRTTLPHQGTLYTRAALAEVGGFDESYRLAGDYEWYLRAFLKHPVAFERLEEIFSVYAGGGASAQDRRKWRAEMRRAQTAHFTRGDLLWIRPLVRLRKILGL